MLANSINLIKVNYKFLLKTLFFALLAAAYLIAFSNSLIYYRTGTYLTLPESLVIGLQGSAFVLFFSFINTVKSSFILSFLLWLLFFLISDIFRQVFSGKEYNLLIGLLLSFFAAISMAHWITKLYNKNRS